jgi:hypothetical protein
VPELVPLFPYSSAADKISPNPDNRNCQQTTPTDKAWRAARIEFDYVEVEFNACWRLLMSFDIFAPVDSGRTSEQRWISTVPVPCVWCKFILFFCLETQSVSKSCSHQSRTSREEEDQGNNGV